MTDFTKLSWFCGWLASVICLFFTIRCAFVFAKREPMLFLSFIVFAASWGVLIVYYSSPSTLDEDCHIHKLPEFLPALNGYLTAIAGSLIYRNRQRNEPGIRNHITKTEGLCGFLLLTLALPEALQNPYGTILPSNIDHHDVEVIITLLLKSVGLFSLYQAVKLCCLNKILKNFAISVLAIYWLLEVSYLINTFFLKHLVQSEKLPMGNFFLLSFAIVKLANVFTFIPAVLSSYKPFRNMSFIENALHFFHIETLKDK